MKNKKYIGEILGLFLLFLSVTWILSSYTYDTHDNIILDKGSNTLIAPYATKYEWLYNGKKLDNPGNKLSVTRSGEYVVALTQKDGKVVYRKINLQVTNEGEVVVVFTIGDSTVQDYNAGYYPRTGWGQVLQYFFDEEKVKVDNRAVGGTSSKNFYHNYWKENGKYSQIVNELTPGDYVFIQFGINDAAADTARHTEPFGSFQDYLTLYVEESKAKGAIPVIVATLRRNAWNNDGTVYSAYHGYPIAARELAMELNVPLIDLDMDSGILMNELGKEYTTSFWYMNLDPGEYKNYSAGSNDNVHFQKSGAIEMARLVVESLQKDTLYPSVDTLAQHISEMHEVSIAQNDPVEGLVTRTASYPEGLEVTLKAKPAVEYTFKEWKNENGEIIGSHPIHTFTMGERDTSFSAEFEFVGLGNSEIWLEAECGEAGSLWNIVENNTASNGQHITIKPGNTSGNSAPGASGWITYTFDVEPGIYNIYLRVLMPSVNDDSFWVKIDGGSWIKVTWDVVIANWEWREMLSMEFEEGSHTLVVAYREDGALLDKIHIGNTLPSGFGSEDNCCCNTTGVEDIDHTAPFSQQVWSNEFNNIFISYDLVRSGNLHYEIYNLRGQSVLSQSSKKLNKGRNDISISADLSPGIYILSSYFEGQLLSQKFLVN